ncbi:hypothetical protein [Bacillus changyiensis]|uniref:hypothetical protein n=1 Tax=Bacillus changyiensis TaxID=3004103 RepID=UPI0022E5FBC2|nr:hypothetical protein [Bacillus changyiensis]MDA1476196.1 hypothetical protein [Bacillus changyiensis]
MGFLDALDSLGNSLGICYTDNERKRDEYEELYDDLKEQKDKMDKKLSELKIQKDGYLNNCDTLLSGKKKLADAIPAWAFEAKRKEKDQELKLLLKHFTDLVDDVESAKNQAKLKWEEYKQAVKAEKAE